MSAKIIKNLEKDYFKKLNKKFTVKVDPLSPLEKGIMKRQNKKFAIPPEKGPQPQGMVFGGMGCPHREMGVKSDIKGISDIQITGKKFIGVK